MAFLTCVMLVATGIFAGGTASFSWARGPLWRSMPHCQFVEDFAATLLRADKVQPPLLLTALAATATFSWAEEGQASLWAGLGAAGLALTLAGSIAFLVPLQRRLIANPSDDPNRQVMRTRWLRAQAGRATLSMASFVAVVVAVVS